MATEGRSRADTGAAEDFFPITGDDANDIPTETREIILAVGGALKVRKLDDTDVTLQLPAGRFALRVKRVFATGTTASGITGVV